ncbi:MAG: hypothetical protein DRJ62_00630 [Thermoprotei archaeon]|nr:MAG: hypothetical protein DRJ62_00630 [Thermoprotei archaeon]
MKILKLKEVTLPTVKELLEERQQRAPLEPYQSSALHHASRFAKLPPDKAESLVKELVESFKMSRATAIQIANTMPSSIPELRTILARETKVFLTEDLEKMLNIIASYST